MPPEKGHPIDSPVMEIIDRISEENRRGAVLAIKEELQGEAKAISITVSSPPTTVGVHPLPAHICAHEFGDAASLILYAQKFGKPENSVIFVGDNAVKLVLDEKQETGTRAVLGTMFQYAPEWSAWETVFKRQFTSHGDLLDHLVCHSHTLVDPLILERLRSAPVHCAVRKTSDIRRIAREIGFVYTAEAGEALALFPERFGVKVPIFVDDMTDPNRWALIQVDLLIRLPDSPNEQVRFGLRAVQLASIRRRRLEEEFNKIKTALAEWIVLRGEPKYAGDQNTKVVVDGK